MDNTGSWEKAWDIGQEWAVLHTDIEETLSPAILKIRESILG